MYSRDACHLCDEALVVVDAVCKERGVDYQVVDIDTDPDLRAKYTDEVPVVTVDGEVVGFWRIRAEQVRTALQARGLSTRALGGG